MKGFLETMSCLTIPECSEDQVGMLATYGFVDFPGVRTLLRGQEWATENLQIHAWSTGPTCCKTLCSGIAERLRPGCVDLRQVGQLRKKAVQEASLRNRRATRLWLECASWIWARSSENTQSSAMRLWVGSDIVQL